ncbi:LysM peptidoglycan-binding domain-containing protein [Cephaloticoccus capnophilus]|nr:LysM domain-containing protein [Cephaloticoccus capnophilus]
MDTIGSREPNSMLPVGAIIVGVIGLLLGGYAALTIGNVKRTLAEHEGKMARFDQFESQVSTAASASEKATRDIGALTRSTQDAFNQVGAELGNLRGAITKLEEAPRTRAAATAAPAANRGNAAAAASANAGTTASNNAAARPAGAASGEYVVKSGDTGVKIAREVGISLGALQNANPDVNWNRLHVGQKLNIPR